MADPAALRYLKNRDELVTALKSGYLPNLDFNSERIRFDFSGLTLADANFSFCDLEKSNFANAYLDRCHFDCSDWRGCDFSHATFNGCYLSGFRTLIKPLGCIQFAE